MSATDSPQASIAALLWRAAARTPDHVAIVEREGETTYATLRARAAAIGAALVRRGVRPGDRVGLLLERSAEAVAAYFGALAAGATVIVVNDRLRPRQIEYVLDHTEAAMLLTRPAILALHPRALATRADVVDLGALATDGATDDAAFVPRPRAAGDHAQIIFTSGSTGLPKGVTFTHGAMAVAVDMVAGYLDVRADDRVASLLPLSSVYGLNQLLTTVARGATLVVVTSPVPQQIVAELAEAEVTVLAAVPPLWLQLLGTPAFRDAPLPRLRVLQNAGGHLPVPAVRQLRAAQPHARLFLQYGQTETFRSTFLAPEDVDAHPDSMGRALPGTHIVVVGEDGQPCAPGEVGELVFRGPTVASGYWNDDARSAEVFRPDPFDAARAARGERVVFSGDLVRADTTGRLFYVARRDRLIKTLGFRVGPDEIADVLYAAAGVREAVVDAEPDAQRGDRIVAHLVLGAGAELRQVEAFCRMELPRHMQPARFVAWPALPRLASGKFDYEALRAGPAVAAAPSHQEGAPAA